MAPAMSILRGRLAGKFTFGAGQVNETIRRQNDFERPAQMAHGAFVGRYEPGRKNGGANGYPERSSLVERPRLVYSTVQVRQSHFQVIGHDPQDGDRDSRVMGDREDFVAFHIDGLGTAARKFHS